MRGHCEEDDNLWTSWFSRPLHHYSNLCRTVVRWVCAMLVLWECATLASQTVDSTAVSTYVKEIDAMQCATFCEYVTVSESRCLKLTCKGLEEDGGMTANWTTLGEGDCAEEDSTILTNSRARFEVNLQPKPTEVNWQPKPTFSACTARLQLVLMLPLCMQVNSMYVRRDNLQ